MSEVSGPVDLPNPNDEDGHDQEFHEALQNGPEGLVPPDLPENTPPQPDEMLQTECAFVVYKTAEGIWAADSTLLGKPVAMAREANLHDMRHAAQDIIYGITMQETAQTTVMIHQQATMSLMQKAQQQAEFARLQAATGVGGLDLSDLGKK